MNIFNNWRAFLIIGVILSFLLQRYTDFEGWAYLFISLNKDMQCKKQNRLSENEWKEKKLIWKDLIGDSQETFSLDMIEEFLNNKLDKK